MFRSVKVTLFCERNSFTLPQNIQPGWLNTTTCWFIENLLVLTPRGTALRFLDEPVRAPRGSKAGRSRRALQSNSARLDAKERNERNDKMKSRRSSAFLGRPARVQTFDFREARLAPLVAALWSGAQSRRRWGWPTRCPPYDQPAGVRIACPRRTTQRGSGH